jgi:hypothetical protein
MREGGSKQERKREGEKGRKEGSKKERTREGDFRRGDEVFNN